MFHSLNRRANRYQQLTEGLSYSPVQPSPLQEPKLAHLHTEFAEALGFSTLDFTEDNFLRYIAGEKLPDDIHPLAMNYSGHQFGTYNPQLGDGRAMMITEIEDKQGQRWELQLKGSGPTPYSRGFDGRAVLRSVIREHLASEALNALGTPTTRSLCVIDSNTPVTRETMENGALTIRLSPTHIRFGSFELLYHTKQFDELTALADFCIRHYFPDIDPNDEDKYALWFDDIVRRTASMIGHWQAQGFCHGVMNTDNFSILGLTFDYGPYGFLDTYNPSHICNHSDHQGRYAYDQQPRIGLWNCLCLGQALSTLINKERLHQSLDLYEKELQDTYLELMRKKLGLLEEKPTDNRLTMSLLNLMEEQQLDYHLFLRGLSDWDGSSPPDQRVFQNGDLLAINLWMQDYSQRLREETTDPEMRGVFMRQHNPIYILRNHIAQKAITAAEHGDYTELERVFALVTKPFDEVDGMEAYSLPASESDAEISVSCSS